MGNTPLTLSPFNSTVITVHEIKEISPELSGQSINFHFTLHSTTKSTRTGEISNCVVAPNIIWNSRLFLQSLPQADSLTVEISTKKKKVSTQSIKLETISNHATISVDLPKIGGNGSLGKLIMTISQEKGAENVELLSHALIGGIKQAVVYMNISNSSFNVSSVNDHDAIVSQRTLQFLNDHDDKIHVLNVSSSTYPRLVTATTVHFKFKEEFIQFAKSQKGVTPVKSHVMIQVPKEAKLDPRLQQVMFNSQFGDRLTVTVDSIEVFNNKNFGKDVKLQMATASKTGAKVDSSAPEFPLKLPAGYAKLGTVGASFLIKGNEELLQFSLTASGFLGVKSTVASAAIVIPPKEQMLQPLQLVFNLQETTTSPPYAKVVILLHHVVTDANAMLTQEIGVLPQWSWRCKKVESATDSSWFSTVSLESTLTAMTASNAGILQILDAPTNAHILSVAIVDNAPRAHVNARGGERQNANDWYYSHIVGNTKLWYKYAPTAFQQQATSVGQLATSAKSEEKGQQPTSYQPM